MAECCGTREGEVDVDVVERNGKVAAGAGKAGDPKCETHRDDDEGGPDVEGERGSSRGAHSRDEPRIGSVWKNFRNMCGQLPQAGVCSAHGNGDS